MDKLNRLMTDPNFDCRLVIQRNFGGSLNGKLYVRSARKEWSVAVESETLTDILSHLDEVLKD